ncbi:Zinc finger and BTB domain-containing protein 48 [Schistosoma japonicum]|nr:Zinc finger and BTB domain-containing protein 48 [Schistosoma japonicum]
MNLISQLPPKPLGAKSMRKIPIYILTSLSAEKPFLCPYCHHGFAREWSYHQHLRKYHNDLVFSL